MTRIRSLAPKVPLGSVRPGKLLLADAQAELERSSVPKEDLGNQWKQRRVAVSKVIRRAMSKVIRRAMSEEIRPKAREEAFPHRRPTVRFKCSSHAPGELALAGYI